MGMRRDMTQRETLARIDDVHRRSRVAAARESIYEKNLSINGVGVKGSCKRILLCQLLCVIFNLHIFTFFTVFFSERFFEQTFSVRILLVPHARCRPHA
jgi:hypothetical protein